MSNYKAHNIKMDSCPNAGPHAVATAIGHATIGVATLRVPADQALFGKPGDNDYGMYRIPAIDMFGPSYGSWFVGPPASSNPPTDAWKVTLPHNVAPLDPNWFVTAVNDYSGYALAVIDVHSNAPQGRIIWLTPTGPSGFPQEIGLPLPPNVTVSRVHGLGDYSQKFAVGSYSDIQQGSSTEHAILWGVKWWPAKDPLNPPHNPKYIDLLKQTNNLGGLQYRLDKDSCASAIALNNTTSMGYLVGGKAWKGKNTDPLLNAPGYTNFDAMVWFISAVIIILNPDGTIKDTIPHVHVDKAVNLTPGLHGSSYSSASAQVIAVDDDVAVGSINHYLHAGSTGCIWCNPSMLDSQGNYTGQFVNLNPSPANRPANVPANDPAYVYSANGVSRNQMKVVGNGKLRFHDGTASQKQKDTQHALVWKFGSSDVSTWGAAPDPDDLNLALTDIWPNTDPDTITAFALGINQQGHIVGFANDPVSNLSQAVVWVSQ
jgi:hypothetical protein